MTEAANPADEQFGEKRLENSVRNHLGASSESLIEQVLGDVLHFQKDAPVADDITMVCLQT